MAGNDSFLGNSTTARVYVFLVAIVVVAALIGGAIAWVIK